MQYDVEVSRCRVPESIDRVSDLLSMKQTFGESSALRGCGECVLFLYRSTTAYCFQETELRLPTERIKKRGDVRIVVSYVADT